MRFWLVASSSKDGLDGLGTRWIPQFKQSRKRTFEVLQRGSPFDPVSAGAKPHLPGHGVQILAIVP